MKIVHVASGDAWGGAERVLALLAEGTRARGLSVEVLLFNAGRLADVLRQRGIPVSVIPESEHSFARLVRETRRWLKGRGPDVVHAHRYKEILTVTLARIPRRGSCVATIHGLEPRAQLPRRRLLLIWGALAAGRLAGVRYATVSSELTWRLRRRLGQSSCVYIPNPIPNIGDDRGVPDLRRQFHWSASTPLVGFVGRLEEVKGPDIFVDVAARCQVDARFVIIGGGSLADALATRVQRTGLAGRIGFLGEVPDAAPYIRQFDVFALSSRHEGLPLVLLEAAASGVPIVAFDVGGVREVLWRGSTSSRLVPAADQDNFRVALEALLRDREIVRTAAAELAAAVRAEFGLVAVSSAYERLYRLAAPGPPERH
jgi:glycosyltransferase involved in cell wall biosynthesis